MARKVKPLRPNQLRYKCGSKCIPFKTTEDAPSLQGPLGQERALKAIDFGLRMEGPGYNLFTVGTPGSGRSSTATTMVKERALTREVPLDWAYVYNFFIFWYTLYRYDFSFSSDIKVISNYYINWQ